MNPFADAYGHLPLGEMAEVTDDMRATVPSGSLIDVLGIHLTHAGPGAARGLMTIAAQHLNQAGGAQAGTIVSLADAVAGWAAKTALKADTRFVTLELNANLLRTAQLGAVLEAVAAPLHIGRSCMVIEVKVRDLSPDRPADSVVAAFRCTELVLR